MFKVKSTSLLKRSGFYDGESPSQGGSDGGFPDITRMIKGIDLITLGYAKNIETETVYNNDYTYTVKTYATMTQNMYVASTVEGSKDKLSWPRSIALAPKNARVVIRTTEVGRGMVKYTYENNYYFYPPQK